MFTVKHAKNFAKFEIDLSLGQCVVLQLNIAYRFANCNDLPDLNL